MDEAEKILIQGIEGSNHDLAVKTYFEDSAKQIIPCRTFNELFDRLVAGEAGLAMVAIENTLAGSLLPNYNLLMQSGMWIRGELKMRISHHLMALPGQQPDTLTEVHSHPMALAQCEQFLSARPHLRQVATDDTAEAAKHIAEMNLTGVAAIASHMAAQIFGLEVYAANVETNPKNFTRFLLIGQKPASADPEADKSSLMFTLPHKTGSLASVLGILANHGMNLTKIQSMPIVGSSWEYRFFADLVFPDDQQYRKAIAELQLHCGELKVLGEYVSHEKKLAMSKVVSHETC